MLNSRLVIRRKQDSRTESAMHNLITSLRGWNVQLELQLTDYRDFNCGYIERLIEVHFTHSFTAQLGC